MTIQADPAEVIARVLAPRVEEVVAPAETVEGEAGEAAAEGDSGDAGSEGDSSEG